MASMIAVQRDPRRTMRKAAEELGYINTIGHVIKMTAVISAVKRDNKTYRPIVPPATWWTFVNPYFR